MFSVIEGIRYPFPAGYEKKKGMKVFSASTEQNAISKIFSSQCCMILNAEITQFQNVYSNCTTTHLHFILLF